MITDFITIILYFKLKRHLCVPRHMAADVYDAGQPCNVCRKGFDGHAQRGCRAAKTLRAKTKRVNAQKRFFV